MRSAKSLMRTGDISSNAYNATLARTKAHPSKMAEFNSRAGAADQGSGKDSGHAIADRRHIDKNKAKGSVLGSAPKSSAKGSNTPKNAHIDNYPNTKKDAPQTKLIKADPQTMSHNKKMTRTKTSAKNYYGGPGSKSNY
jgi:hypothetical protein